MRWRGAATIILALGLACASTGTVSERAFLFESRSVVWQAATRAMQDVGARIVASAESAGTLAGVVDMVELGGRVRIDVRVASAAGASDLEGAGTDLDVSVVLEGSPNDDPELRSNLAEVRDTYITAVKWQAAVLRSKSGR
jgi:hypothetical protein